MADAVPADHRNASPGHCDGTIGRTAVDEVDVPSGATCTLVATTVNGNVTVGAGATLTARGVKVDGDIEGRRARVVGVSHHSTIGGNLQLARGGLAAVTNSRIRGDLQWSEQTGTLTVQRSTIGGNLQAMRNHGWLTVTGNRIRGDLECGLNRRAPISARNAVRGHREGQCAAPAPRRVTRPHPHPVATPRPVHHRPPCAGDSVSDDPSDDQCDAGDGED